MSSIFVFEAKCSGTRIANPPFALPPSEDLIAGLAKVEKPGIDRSAGDAIQVSCRAITSN